MNITVADNPVSIREQIEECEKVKARYMAGSPQYNLFQREIAALKEQLEKHAVYA